MTEPTKQELETTVEKQRETIVNLRKDYRDLATENDKLRKLIVNQLTENTK